MSELKRYKRRVKETERETGSERSVWAVDEVARESHILYASEHIEFQFCASKLTCCHYIKRDEN